MKRISIICALFLTIFLIVSCTDFEDGGRFDSLTVDKTELSYPWQMTTYTIVIHSGKKWEISDMPKWVHDDINNSDYKSYNWTLTIKTTENEGYDRSDSFTISTDSESVTISIFQAGIKGAKPSIGTENGYEWVDLGLPSGLNWATCNVGAASPEEYGNYYAWGEIQTKTEYGWTNYKFTESGDSDDNVTFNKYNTKSDRGTVDNKKTLSFVDDVARAKMGGSWRMPTKDEFDELKDNCTWIWTTQGGHNGYKLTSKKNGNSIFLPAAGWHGPSLYDAGYRAEYWSSSLGYNSHCAYAFDCEDFRTEGGYYRRGGHSVRAVTE